MKLGQSGKLMAQTHMMQKKNLNFLECIWGFRHLPTGVPNTKASHLTTGHGQCHRRWLSFSTVAALLGTWLGGFEVLVVNNDIYDLVVKYLNDFLGKEGRGWRWFGTRGFCRSLLRSESLELRMLRRSSVHRTSSGLVFWE